jgi:hypothetical protein
LLAGAKDKKAEAENNGSALSAILKVIGVEDPDAALAALPTLVDAKNKLADLGVKLDEALNINVQNEEAVAEQEVEQAMAARNWDDEGIKFALRQLRGLNAPDDATAQVKLDALIKGKATFAEKYPAPKAGQEHLTSPMLAKVSGTQLAPNADGNGVALKKAGSSPIKPNTDGRQVIDLTAYEGRNTTERVMEYVRANVAGAKDWKREAVFTAACRLKAKDSGVEIIDPIAVAEAAAKKK